MSIGWVIIAAIVALWAFITTVILATDAWARRYYGEQIETRDWQEKVAAMKRMQDEEGEA